MAKKDKKEPIINGDVQVKILKDWKHPFGTMKKENTVLTVDSGYAAELIAEGIAEINL